MTGNLLSWEAVMASSDKVPKLLEHMIAVCSWPEHFFAGGTLLKSPLRLENVLRNVLLDVFGTDLFEANIAVQAPAE